MCGANGHSGTGHTCRRADVSDNVNNKSRTQNSNSPGALTQQSSAQGASFTEPPINERLLSLVTTLSDRVQRLEEKIDGNQRRLQFSPENVDPSLFPLGTGTQSSNQLERPSKRPRIETNDTISAIPSLSKENVRPDENESGPTGSDAEVEDAATVLEFLAWGRIKDSNLTSGIREPNIHDPAARPDSDVLQGVQAAWGASPSSVPSGSVVLDNLHISQVQELLPSKMQVFQLFEYHSDSLLFLHCSFHVPTFRKELNQFYDDDHGIIQMTSVGLQWASLLFAIMCASIACVKPRNAQKLGFQEEEQGNLGKKWYQASVECLNAARYQQYHNVYSVQAIACTTFSAHLLGFSNAQSVMLASAVRIAQSLGFHRLSSSKNRGSQSDHTGNMIQAEIGKRLWQQLTMQDWFSVPFSETYCINPTQFTTEAPKECDEETMQAVLADKPTITTYSNFLIRVAAIMPALQDRSAQARTLHSKYEQVLIFDKMMRELVVTQLPSCLNSQTQIDPLWPSYIGIARRCLTITSAHKIIMIHRRFLGMSFKDQRYSFTRRTCLAAAKTIINEMKADVQDESPNLWTNQAFVVAASIILILDNFNRQQSAREYEEHRSLVNDALGILAPSVAISSIASRGTRLVSELLVEQEKHTESNNDTAPNERRSSNHLSIPERTTEKSLNVAAFVKKFCQNDAATTGGSPLATSHMPLWLQQEDSAHSYDRSRGQGFNEGVYDSPGNMNAFQQSQQMAQHHSYGMPEQSIRQQDPAIPPFAQHLSDSFDIRSLNWLDDLMGLAPSNSL